MARAASRLRRPAERVWGNFSSSVCRTCLQRRGASTATAPVPAIDHLPTLTPDLPPSTARALDPGFSIRAGVVVSRPPLLTSDLAPFEKAFYFYQKRLNERLALPFSRYFYFQKNTPADVDWKKKIKTRRAATRDVGSYNAYCAEAWHDELLVGAKESEPEDMLEKLIMDMTIEEEDDGELGASSSRKKEVVTRPQERVTEADRGNDVRSLNRALQRTLYLLVKGKDGQWTFPSDVLDAKEPLHRAAERILVQAAGPNMNTWLVANHPVGHWSEKEMPVSGEKAQKPDQKGEKTFFLKVRIMAGKADLSKNKFGLSDFQWLAKEEVEKAVNPHYWLAIRNMLVWR